MKLKRSLVAIAATVAVGGALASPAAAANRQEGLVNVAVEDVTVQLPIAVAANVCDVNVAVLAEVRDRAAACEATADSVATSGPNSGGNTRQDGLVNVLLDDILVQAPITVAANVCDVNVAVLARLDDRAEACEADADAAATQGSGPGGQNGSGGANGIFVPIDIDLGGLFSLDNDTSDDGGLGDVITGAV